jgi:hypothetical protein
VGDRSLTDMPAQVERDERAPDWAKGYKLEDLRDASRLCLPVTMRVCCTARLTATATGMPQTTSTTAG